jgi:rubrerythrin
MKRQLFITFMLIAGIAILSSCGGGNKPADDKKTDTVQTVTNPTIENLIAAIKGETTASQKYAAFAQKAREEKINAVAILFDAASAAEKIHAAKHTEVLTKMGGKMPEFKPEFEVKTTEENLDAAIKGETDEFTNMYPGYIKTADEAEYDDAVASFEAAKTVEQKHADLYTAALKALNENKVNTLPISYSVCPKCGMTYDSKKLPAKECEICGTSIEKFTLYK